jgi:dephospho-CoA kinase
VQGYNGVFAEGNATAMSEIVFLVEEDPDGGFTARALGEAVFTQAESMPKLRDMVRDAVRCHFPDEATRPKVIRLHSVHDEVIAA